MYIAVHRNEHAHGVIAVHNQDLWKFIPTSIYTASKPFTTKIFGKFIPTSICTASEPFTTKIIETSWQRVYAQRQSPSQQRSSETSWQRVYTQRQSPSQPRFYHRSQCFWLLVHLRINLFTNAKITHPLIYALNNKLDHWLIYVTTPSIEYIGDRSTQKSESFRSWTWSQNPECNRKVWIATTVCIHWISWL